MSETLQALLLLRKYSLKELQRLLRMLAGLFIVPLTPADITLLEAYSSPCRSFSDVCILQDPLTVLVTLQRLYIVPYVVPCIAYFAPEHGLHLSFLVSNSRRGRGGSSARRRGKQRGCRRDCLRVQHSWRSVGRVRRL